MSDLQLPKYLLSDAPRNVYWETTIACSLSCQHCRAEAIKQRDPLELTTEEGFRLIEDVHELGSLLVLTGGDPLERPDLVNLVEYARKLHVPVAVTPSTTPTLKRETVQRLHELGITALGVSLDGPTPEVHDTFRGISGTFAHSQAALAWAREFEVPVQINTTVTQFTRPHLEELYEVLCRNSPPVRRWSLFMLIPTGRGHGLAALNASDVDELFGWAYSKTSVAPFHISTVEAPHYRRYWLERKRAEGIDDAELVRLGPRMGFGIRDGNGVVFVARNGRRLPCWIPAQPEVGQCASNTALQALSRICRTAFPARHGTHCRAVVVAANIVGCAAARVHGHGPSQATCTARIPPAATSLRTSVKRFGRDFPSRSRSTLPESPTATPLACNPSRGCPWILLSDPRIGIAQEGRKCGRILG